ncbi:ATP-binding protein [Corynebacterium mendelii]|uniref:ATP-binding protein n=1 Tax=Corynebacterium mendelii TaxID=2765362 RepID=UPI002105B9AA|nr:ATP-binding protein [Corynebacterium mendelii]
MSFTDKAEDRVFYGDAGCGKTHLATAIVHQACTRGIPARFTTASNLVTGLRKAKREGRLNRESAALRKTTHHRHQRPGLSAD